MAQKDIPLQHETVAIDSADKVFVGVQHAYLARIDLLPYQGKRRVALNLFGTRQIDELIEALTQARADMLEERDRLERNLRTYNLMTGEPR